MSSYQNFFNLDEPLENYYYYTFELKKEEIADSIYHSVKEFNSKLSKLTGEGKKKRLNIIFGLLELAKNEKIAVKFNPSLIEESIYFLNFDLVDLLIEFGDFTVVTRYIKHILDFSLNTFDMKKVEKILKFIIPKCKNLNEPLNHSFNSSLIEYISFLYIDNDYLFDIIKLVIECGAICSAQIINGIIRSRSTKLNVYSRTFKLLKFIIPKCKDLNEYVKNVFSKVNLLTVEVIKPGKVFFSLLKLLVENGADVNKKDKNNNRPLYEATTYGFVEVIEYLLQNKAIIQKDEVVYVMNNLKSYFIQGEKFNDFYERLKGTHTENFVKILELFIEYGYEDSDEFFIAFVGNMYFPGDSKKSPGKLYEKLVNKNRKRFTIDSAKDHIKSKNLKANTLLFRKSK